MRGDDSEPIKKALGMTMPSIEVYIREKLNFSDAEELYKYIMEQKNSDRIINRVCTELKEWKDVEAWTICFSKPLLKSRQNHS